MKSLPKSLSIFTLVGIVVIIGVLVTIVKPTPLEDGQTRKVRLDRTVLTANIVGTRENTSKGLMGRSPLTDTEGMVFLLGHQRLPSFWMKGVSFPIDIIWVSGGTVTEITPNVPPADPAVPDESLPRYVPSVPVDTAIEVRAGWSAAHGVQPGDPLKVL